MAKAVITEKSGTAKIIEPKPLVKITEWSNQKSLVTIGKDLPFRVKFTNIMVPGYSSSNVPPIGIALIGINNYIL